MKLEAIGICGCERTFAVDVVVELVDAAKRQVTFEYTGRCPACKRTPIRLQFTEEDTARLRQFYAS